MSRNSLTARGVRIKLSVTRVQFINFRDAISARDHLAVCLRQNQCLSLAAYYTLLKH